jgi:hypothetical protein
MTKVIIFILLVLLYFHIYHCFKINKENTIFHIDYNKISKNELDREVLFKVPMYFEMKNIELGDCNDVSYNDNKTFYESPKKYEKYNMLEPNISFDVSTSLIKLDSSKNHVAIDQPLSFRNFYIVHKAPIDVYLIHPQYSINYMKNDVITTNEKNIQLIKESSHHIKIKLFANSVLYVPNYWLVYYERDSTYEEKDDAIIEEIHYVPLVNKLNYLYKNVMSKKRER